jgi:hypothetical protein
MGRSEWNVKPPLLPPLDSRRINGYLRAWLFTCSFLIRSSGNLSRPTGRAVLTFWSLFVQREIMLDESSLSQEQPVSRFLFTGCAFSSTHLQFHIQRLSTHR